MSYAQSIRFLTAAEGSLLAAIRVLLGAILLLAGLSKMRDPFLFLSEVYDYQMVGRTTGVAIAIILPTTEVLVGCFLLFGLLLPGAFALAAFLAAIFTYATASALASELGITCGCFTGAAVGKIGYDTVIRSGVMLLSAVTGLILANRSRTLKPSNSHLQEPSIQPSSWETSNA